MSDTNDTSATDIERRGWTCTDCNLKKEGIDPDNCPNCGSGNIVVELGMENGTVRYVDTETEQSTNSND